MGDRNTNKGGLMPQGIGAYERAVSVLDGVALVGVLVLAVETFVVLGIVFITAGAL